MIISICINVDCIHAINVATIGLDDSLMSSYLSEDESGNDDIKKVINDFRIFRKRNMDSEPKDLKNK